MAFDFLRTGLLALAGVASCGGSTHTPIDNSGAERQPCYPNHTCNDGLTCLSEVCVKLPMGNDAAGSFPMDLGDVRTSDAANPLVMDVRASSFPDAGVMPPVGGFSEVPLTFVGSDPLWATYNDCDADPQNCTTGGNEPYRDFDTQPYCTKGTAARFDGFNFGAGIVLGFDGAGPQNSIDAIAAGIVGFSFDITGASPGAVSVDMQSAKLTPDVLAWGHYGDAPLGKRTAVTFDELTTNPYSTPMDPHTLTLLSFSVAAGPAAIPFDYCVANVKMLKR